ncbi:uncharacterized protein CDV56_102428 [Aspergillus thermomutatus]|uniref:Uncharacterized protein n=1 Tax=Aspergillus thermomutatus TaxID=41047 RepID=A0A397GQ53_ASPTH|nr:uncharacterized protein CDV56_102428 [Aspergillus thermomutatus]RHZ51788.1 hypothetical protein CDV56_102428 [Aspergillus thermomutatus]
MTDQDASLGRRILLWGSLALSFDASSFEHLRKTVIENEDNIWLAGVLKTLPQACETALSALPTLHRAIGSLTLKQLADLNEALTTGRPLDAALPLPNTLLIPLVVVAQLAQYVEFLRQTSPGDGDGSVRLHNGETLGLCTGLLSAFAASSAHNMDELRRYGAAAMRLGLLVGLVVDGQDEALARGRSRSLSAAWSSAEGHGEMMRIVKDSPDAYVSVHYDENRATITSCADGISDLARRLQAAGIGASEISLYGRFHFPGNSALVDELIAFCDSHPDFQLPDASSLNIPARANDSTASLLRDGSLHAHALRSILVEPPRWYEAFSTAVQADSENTQVVEVLDFGPERSVPLSLAAKGSLKMHVVHLADQAAKGKTDRRSERMWLDSDIAVVGMACKVPGANSVDDFWDLLVAGQSQHREIRPGGTKSSSDRFSFQDTPFRTAADANMDRKWFANLIDGHDQFDHRFFKKSARESAAMDPQQRHILQVAYQAVEQSGYFQQQEKTGSDARRIGCFVGVCLGDYDNNVACHAANAFTATGNLQGFISGKVSHFFGWTGPGLTINTACSSSLVAVHQACQSILAGECEAALAGGSHIMTSAEWFQNLAAGSFLSPTGQCKPFDAKVDGYCRGEGVGAVFLKKMSKAVADGDPILGVVAATGVQQNENCTPIFVPNTLSLGDLFTRVMAKAKVRPSQISVVEAHGTGTAVGDPAEYDSIRKALGGPKNRGSGKQLMVSSVKGLVGHLECTSGVISLIKVLLMMNKGILPPQASFDTVNPALKASPADQMFIPTRAQPWDADFRAALINNYGASGSNASAVILQAPSHSRHLGKIAAAEMPTGVRYPFWLSGFEDKALHRYVHALRMYLGRSTRDTSLANLSFNLARQSNRTLDSSMIFTARSFEEMDRHLAAFEESNDETNVISGHPASSPTVIMCFRGQVSSYIGLDPQLYHSVAVLRKHLDRVDAVVQSLGCPSIFPGIFQRTPISDTVQLQVMLLAMQYACARSWMDSGTQPAALVGHSFGELTALCISQILSLEDTVKMIVRRATLVRDDWGSDKGAMMAVEGDPGDVREVLANVNRRHSDKPAGIACYNGPRSFTLAGPTAAIDAVATQLESNRMIKAKKLNVTNAFHSVLVDPIYDGLEQNARGLTFRKPVIPLELATEENTRETELTARFVANHMRHPVYFHHAVERLARRYSSSPCIFLEAGTNSTITSMAARALANVKGTYSFHGVNVASCEDGWNRLTDTTVSLWKAGLRVQHWAHHGLQREHQADIKPLLLPPYQFDPDSRHWMELKTPPKALPAPTGDGKTQNTAAEKQPEGHLAFVGYQDGAAQRRAQFRVNTRTERYKQLLAGHVTMGTAPILSATLQIGFVIDAIGMLRPEYRSSAQLQPQIQEVEYKSPVCANAARTTWIEISSTDALGVAEWRFEVFSTANGCQKQKRMVHTIGRVALSDPNDPSLQRQLLRFARLFGHGRAVELLQSADVNEALANRSIYRLFSEIVDYGDEFRGLQKMVVRGHETAGHVVRHNQDPEVWFDPHLADTFCQLGGLWINCMTDRARSDVYLANGIDQWIRAHPTTKRPSDFHAFAVHHRPSDQLSLTDVFVFDAADGVLVEVILGIAYVKIPKTSMEKLLSSLTDPSWMAKTSSDASAPAFASIPAQQAPTVQSETQPKVPTAEPKPQKQSEQALQDLTLKVKAIIADLSGLGVAEIGDDSQLADLGIDSLAGMEMVHEIESTLKVKLPQADVLMLTDMPSLMACVAGAMGIHTQPHVEPAEEDSNEDSDRDTPSIMSSSDGDTSLSTPAPEPDIKEEHHAESGELTLPFETVMEAFNETKQLTDTRIAEMEQTSYVARSLPLQNELTVALTVEAFEALGAGLQTAQPGTQLPRIPHGKEHDRFVTYLYEMLEAETQTIKLDGNIITRTAVPLPQRPSRELYEELLRDHPDQHCATQLTYYAGANLQHVLSGGTDGVKLIFGSTEGRDLVGRWYAEWPLNRVLIAQMEDFFTRLCAKLRWPGRGEPRRPLRILEMGAGTGGTTKRIVPLLARLGVPVEYTFTDLAPSFVAAARKTWGREYPWMKFRAHDIERAPEKELEGTQHFVIASNAVHATRSLCVSTGNVRKALRPDGFLVMMEMTRTPYWVDLIFGLFEGWWLFDDGRRHALTHESRWERDLQAAGYGHVDWTDGDRPESEVQKVILAAADPTSRCERLPSTSSILPGYHQPKLGASADCTAREQVVTRYVQELTHGFDMAMAHAATGVSPSRPEAKCVLITGGTGGLGAHLVAEAALRPDVTRVVCLNRPAKHQPPHERQMQALHKKGLALPADAVAKIHVLEAKTDMAQSPTLGLSNDEYRFLLQHVTHIVHNAWLMHSKWPVTRFEPHLRIMAHMLHLAAAISAQRPRNRPVTFQFISSIATVGHHPFRTGKPVIPEDRVTIDSVLPTGYGDAKYICERMLDATLHRHPDRFRATAVRLGQIAGSAINGHWNPMEHVPFLFRSSQTLGALPDLPGTMGWTPADDVARGLLEILTQPDEVALYPIYHIENPVRQPWAETLAVLADEMGIPRASIIPFPEWVQRVRDWPRREDNGSQGANPGYLLVDFLDSNFIRMSCGGLVMGTAKAREHSPTLAKLGPVSERLIRLFVQSWKDMGFLE